MPSLLVKDLMWSDSLQTISPDATLKEAADRMVAKNCGVLPVGTNGKLEGIITDRDIVVRAVSKDRVPSKEKVKSYMTTGVHVCKETDTVKSAAEIMKKHKVGRLAVMNSQNELSGILSFGHILRNDANAEEVAEIVTRVSDRNGSRNSKQAAAQ